jgi:pyruvate/2-oxoglutarate dehydrogenase complex dihydrolipoamide dehydrogenase (E3) component
MGDTERYDAIIIGAGQGGGPLASAFAKAGRRTLLVERTHIGGTCINEGCTPTKTMIASGRVAYLARRGADYGVRTGDVTVDLARVRERKRAIVEQFRTSSEQALAKAGVEVEFGHARFLAPHTIEIEKPNGSRIEAMADIIVINTGMRSLVPNIAGLSDVPTLDSTSIMELDTIPEHLLVLGGGYVGLEFAQLFRRFGSRVTIIHRGAQLLPREDSDIGEAIANILRQDEIDLCLDATTTAVARTANGGVKITVKAKDTAGPLEIVGSQLLLAVGRTPNTEDLGVEAAGIALDDKGCIKVNARLETTAHGVYALGDVKGGPAFTHISYDDFRILRTNLLHNGNASTDGRLVPYTVFTDPQLGRAGLTEEEARKAGFDVRVAKLPMSEIARALEMNEARGVMKAVVDGKTKRILGVAVLGIEGGEVAAQLQIAMMGNLPYTTLRDAVFSHPTLSESINNLFAKLDDAVI